MHSESEEEHEYVPPLHALDDVVQSIVIEMIHWKLHIKDKLHNMHSVSDMMFLGTFAKGFVTRTLHISDRFHECLHILLVVCNDVILLT